MPLQVVYLGEKRASEDYGKSVDTFGAQAADAFTVADAAVSGALASEGYYRIAAVGAATRVRIGDGALANANNGEYWPSDWIEIRRLDAGMKIAAAAWA